MISLHVLLYNLIKVFLWVQSNSLDWGPDELEKYPSHMHTDEG